MMSERKLSALHVCAAPFWVVGLFLIALQVLFGYEGLGSLGLLLAMVGGVVNIRAMLFHMEDRLISRERSAFDLGREVGPSRF